MAAQQWQGRRRLTAPLLLTAGICSACILMAMFASVQPGWTGLVEVKYLSSDTRKLAKEESVFDEASDSFSALEEKLSELTKDVLSSKHAPNAAGSLSLKNEVQATEKKLDRVGSRMTRAHALMNQDISRVVKLSDKGGETGEAAQGKRSSPRAMVASAVKERSHLSDDDPNQMLASSEDHPTTKTLDRSTASQKPPALASARAAPAPAPAVAVAAAAAAVATAPIHPLKHHHQVSEDEEDEDLKVRRSARKDVLRAFRFFEKHQQQKLQEALKAKELEQAKGYDVTPEENCKGDDCHIRLYLHVGSPRMGHTARNGANFVPNLRDLRNTIRERGLVYVQSGVDMCEQNPAACQGFQTVYKGKDFDVSYVPPHQDFVPVGGQAHSGVRHPIGTPDVRIPEHAFKSSPRSPTSLKLQNIVGTSFEPIQHHGSNADEGEATKLDSSLLVPAAMKIAKEQEKLAIIAKKIKKAADLRAQVALAEDTMVKALMNHMQTKRASRQSRTAETSQGASLHRSVEDKVRLPADSSTHQGPRTEDVNRQGMSPKTTGAHQRSIDVRLQEKLEVLNRQMRRDKALLTE